MVSEYGDVHHFLSQHPLFSILPPKLLDDASNHVYVAFERSGASISTRSTDAYVPGLILVRSGSLEVRDDSGQLLDKLSAGDFLILLENESVEVRVLEDALYYELTLPSFQRLLHSSSEFSLCCFTVLQRKKSYHASNGHHFFKKDQTVDESQEVEGARQSQSDLFLLHRYVKDYMSSNVIFVAPEATIQDAASLMKKNNITSLLIKRHGKLVGIVTDRDFRTRVLAEGKSVQTPLQDVMTNEPITIDGESMLYDAQLLMMDSGIHHLPVICNSEIEGIITASDIFRVNTNEPIVLSKSIAKAQSLFELTKISERIPELQAALAERQTSSVEIGEIITLLNDGLTSKLIQLFQSKHGPAPCKFAWLSFGSQARKEQVIGSDQDNALLLDNDIKNQDEHYFSTLATFVCHGLNECGIPFCPGDIMANNEKWRQSVSAWESCFSGWIEERSSKALMHASIFFDLRHVAGSSELTHSLHNFVLEKAKKNTIFLALLCENALTHTPPLGFFKQFVLENDGGHIESLDLKKRGSIPIVEIARIFSLAAGVSAVNTRERLNELKARALMSDELVESLLDAQSFITGLRASLIARQYRQHQGVSNHLDPTTLSPLLRHQLKETFKYVKRAQSIMKMRFGGGFI